MDINIPGVYFSSEETKRKELVGTVAILEKMIYICTTLCGRGGIGRRARLRIWCLAAWGFVSLRPYNKKITDLLFPEKDKQAVFII